MKKPVIASNYTPDEQLFAKPAWWEKPRCPTCQNPLKQHWLDIPRHLAGEWIKKGLLSGEAETVFQSTRDDLGWSAQVYLCEHCKKLRPTRLRHQRS